MQSTKHSAAQSASPPDLARPAVPDDTLMLGFDFFDEKGKLSPRKVLFSAQTSPERAKSILTRVFGGIMKWNARRWAENCLRDLRKTVSVDDARNQSTINTYLRNIRKQGSVNRTDFFRLTATTLLRQASQKTINTEPQRQDRGLRWPSETFFINQTELINSTLIEAIERAPDDAKFSELFKDASEDQITDWIRLHVDGSKQKNLLDRIEKLKKNNTPLHEFIAAEWKKMSSVPGASRLFGFYKEAVESGFIDYCRGKPLSELTDKFDQLEKFISNNSDEFENIQKNFSPSQYATLIEKKNRLNQELPLAIIIGHDQKGLQTLSQNFDQKVFNRQDPPPEEKTALKNPQASERSINTPPSTTTLPEKMSGARTQSRNLIDKPVHESLKAQWENVANIRNADRFLPFQHDAVASGFIDYCQGKPLSELPDKIDALTRFILIYDHEFESLKKNFTDARYREFIAKKDQLADDIEAFRDREAAPKKRVPPAKPQRKDLPRNHRQTQTTERATAVHSLNDSDNDPAVLSRKSRTSSASEQADDINEFRQQLVDVKNWLKQREKPRNTPSDS